MKLSCLSWAVALWKMASNLKVQASYPLIPRPLRSRNDGRWVKRNLVMISGTNHDTMSWSHLNGEIQIASPKASTLRTWNKDAMGASFTFGIGRIIPWSKSWMWELELFHWKSDSCIIQTKQRAILVALWAPKWFALPRTLMENGSPKLSLRSNLLRSLVGHCRTCQGSSLTSWLLAYERFFWYTRYEEKRVERRICIAETRNRKSNMRHILSAFPVFLKERGSILLYFELLLDVLHTILSSFKGSPWTIASSTCPTGYMATCVSTTLAGRSPSWWASSLLEAGECRWWWGQEREQVCSEAISSMKLRTIWKLRV